MPTSLLRSPAERGLRTASRRSESSMSRVCGGLAVGYPYALHDKRAILLHYVASPPRAGARWSPGGRHLRPAVHNAKLARPISKPAGPRRHTERSEDRVMPAARATSAAALATSSRSASGRRRSRTAQFVVTGKATSCAALPTACCDDRLKRQWKSDINPNEQG